uniref:Uncharacterized protein n=1 Tax=Oryza rufipogon TaxID=4529 RepID=A0A0E0PTH2_ORYRU
MGDTVVSMARSLLGGAIAAASSAARQEMSMLIGVQNDIWYIKDELKTMHAFLRAAEVTKEKDELVKVWAEQVRDLAYDIEDCLEEFTIHVKHQSLSRQLMKLRHRHRIAVQIRSLKLRVQEVSNRNMREMDDFSTNMEMTRYQAAHYVDEAKLVGFDGPKKEILKMISGSEDVEVQTIWIVGAGGLGKTTLAKKVYESSNITSMFPCCAWITVSQSFDVMDLLKDMIKQLLGKESLDNLFTKYKEVKIKENNLTDHLTEWLRNKRYFLVLDDLWSTKAWDCLKPTLWGNNREGSRLVVTTRNRDLAEGSSSPLVYPLQTLHREDATKLLLAKTNKSLCDINKDGMNETFEKILKKCGGLPLAIITIGGLLAAKDVKEWDGLYAQIPSELENNPSFEVLALSYKYLPSHLKPCFLYLSIFPEDFEIQRKRLVYRWIAEGFIRARDGVSIVDVAIKYFNDLINRSLMQPSRVNMEGTIKSCRVHDIIRDIMISISREEKFVCRIDDKETCLMEENIHHVAFYNSNSSEIAMDLNQVRSLTVFGERHKELTPLLCSPQVRMLRVLDFQGVRFGMTQKEMDHIWSVLHLKYMNIRCDYNLPNSSGYSKIYRIPRSIGKLQGLRVLDISNTCITSLPTEICELRSLNILRCTRKEYYEFFDPSKPIQCLFALSCIPVTMALADSDQRHEITAELHMACSTRWFSTCGVRVPMRIGNLKQLQELGYVDIRLTSSKAVKELGELSQLKKLRLRINGATQRKCKVLREAIEKLSSLQSLRINAFDVSSLRNLEWLHYISSPPPFLKNLTLEGCIKEIDWLREFTHLVKIHLFGSKLKEGKTVQILGELPNLMVLQLRWGAYVGVKLLFRAEAFPKLRKLEIRFLEDLREMRFEERTSPQMETIEISHCRLESGIIGIKHLPKLKEISLRWNCEVARLGQLLEEVKANPNRPVLLLYNDPSKHDLGDTQEGSGTPVEANEPPKNVGESSQSNQGEDDDDDQQQPITSTEIMPADADPAVSS